MAVPVMYPQATPHSMHAKHVRNFLARARILILPWDPGFFSN